MHMKFSHHHVAIDITFHWYIHWTVIIKVITEQSPTFIWRNSLGGVSGIKRITKFVYVYQLNSKCIIHIRQSRIMMGLHTLVCESAWTSAISHVLTAWITNFIHYEEWDEVTDPFLKFNRLTVEVWERISNFIPHLCMLGLKFYKYNSGLV